MKPRRREWKTIAVDGALADRLAVAMGIPRPIATLLASRGFADKETAEHFLNPRLSRLSDPLEMRGMIPAVERLWDAVLRSQRITVFGDYDADGITATALMVGVLQEMGANVRPFLPERLTDGYGLTVGAVKRCLDSHKPELIITVDCGTGAMEAVEVVRSAGADIIVTDHHEASGRETPEFLIVNPKLDGNEATAPLAGVGVAFKVCHALVKHCLRNNPGRAQNIDLRNRLDLVAVGTVADVVPLVGENRILVRHGLERFDSTTSVGLRALKQIAGINAGVDCYHLGFIIGPRLNAAGRLGSADTALELLLTSDPSRARELAAGLDAANQERKRIEDAIVSEAIKEIDGHFDNNRDFGLVVGRAGWHIGAVGIVAARLCARYCRPAAVIGFDENGWGRGSCRSAESVDIVAVLRACSDLLASFGGHKMAAGFVIEKSMSDTFKKRFNEECAARLAPSDLSPAYRVDAWIGLGEVDETLFNQMQRLKPVGMGNPTPVWGVGGVHLAEMPKKIGKNGEHLKMTVASGGAQLSAVAFGMAEHDIPDGPMDVLFNLQEDTYGGRRRLQLNVKDFRPARTETPS